MLTCTRPSRGRGSWFGALFCAVSLWLLPLRLVAQAPADGKPPAGYDQAVENAFKEFELGNYAEARAGFFEAHRLFPNARMLRALGMVEYELKNYPDSVDYLQQALTSSVKPLEGKARTETEKLLARAKAYVGRISLVLDPPTATVLLNGTPVQVAAGAPLVLAVGDHGLEFSAPGRVSQTRRLKINGGEETTLQVTLAAAAAPAPAPVAPIVAPAPAPAAAPLVPALAAAPVVAPRVYAPVPVTLREAPATVCSADGLATDVRSDPDNCGSCGHSCGGNACVEGRCKSRWERGGFALGLNVGGLWGSSEYDFEEQTFPHEPFDPHWLIGGQLGSRGRRIGAGFRFAVSRGKPYNAQRSFVRFGPFLDVHVYNVDFAGLNLTTYLEAAMNLDVLLYKLDGTDEFGLAATYRELFFGVTPSVGAGVDLGVIGGLRVGVYGGITINIPSTHSTTNVDTSESTDLDVPDLFVGGEFRATIMYRFGSGIAAPPQPVYATFVAQGEAGAAPPQATITATPSYERVRTQFRKLALAAPGCAGAPDPSARLQCSADMDKLERAFAERGYVTAWRMNAADRDRNPVELARQSGAELLIQVAALERVGRVVGGNETDYAWFKSDAWGHVGPPLQSSTKLTPADLSQLQAVAAQHQAAWQQSAATSLRSGVKAEFSAVDVASGETLWTYRTERMAGGEGQRPKLLLEGRALGRDKDARTWQLVGPATASAGSGHPKSASAGAAASPDQLLEEIVRDVADKLQSGQGRSAPAP